MAFNCSWYLGGESGATSLKMRWRSSAIRQNVCRVRSWNPNVPAICGAEPPAEGRTLTFISRGAEWSDTAFGAAFGFNVSMNAPAAYPGLQPARPRGLPGLRLSRPAAYQALPAGLPTSLPPAAPALPGSSAPQRAVGRTGRAGPGRSPGRVGAVLTRLGLAEGCSLRRAQNPLRTQLPFWPKEILKAST